MNRTGRLSLRARLLVVLIAVTAAFLLIMGGVTALVLSKRLGGQFDEALAAAAARSPGQIKANPGDYVAVTITRPPLTVQPLTGSTGATAELASAVQRLIATGDFRGYVGGTPFTVPGTLPRLRAVAHYVQAGRLTRAVLGRRTHAVLIVASPMAAVTRQVSGIVVAELITGGALILLLALGGRWLIGRGLAPLSEMAGTAQRITTQGDLTARMPDAEPSTEVGGLATAINTMLDRIQQAFGARLHSEAKVRQFAADASHELRTPLTTIRGYAELYRQGALGDDQLPDAMRRIEQEARRMGTLVAELLELARLDRTSSLDIAETDLAVLVRDAVADALAVEPARPVRAEAPDSLVAAVDEARIRQVLANLLGNVREHTPVSTATAVRLAQVRGGVVLEVADAGPGMAADDAAQAFDRFHRGAERPGGAATGPAVGYGVGHGPGSAGPDSANGSREARESGGSGLGLAIVAAIAQAHGGQATLESASGHGTRVRVWLPASPPAPPPGPPAPPPAARAPAPRLSHARLRQPLPGSAGDPGPPPAQRFPGLSGYLSSPPAQPLPGSAGEPGSSPAQPVPGPAGYLSAPPAQPVPGPAGDPVPVYPAPPGPPAELHHDWGDPPQPAPLAPGQPGQPTALPGQPTAPPGQPLSRPGRHRRAGQGPQPPEPG
jgi:two-component system, OmpR family, sensor kinase